MHNSIPERVLIAGLPEASVIRLNELLDGVQIKSIQSAEEALDELAASTWPLLIVEHSLPGHQAPELVARTRNELELDELPILYCMDRDADDATIAELSAWVGREQLMFKPIDLENLAERIGDALKQASPAQEAPNSITNEGIQQAEHQTGHPDQLRESSEGQTYRYPSTSAKETRDSQSEEHHSASAHPETLTSNGTASPGERSGEGSRETEARTAVEELWNQFRDANLKRVSVLGQAVSELLDGHLEDELRQQAKRESHKLAGSLGTFGIPKRTLLARKIENLLSGDEPPTLDHIRQLSELVVDLEDEVEGGPGIALDEIDRTHVETERPLPDEDSDVL